MKASRIIIFRLETGPRDAYGDNTWPLSINYSASIRTAKYSDTLAFESRDAKRKLREAVKVRDFRDRWPANNLNSGWALINYGVALIVLGTIT